MGCGDEPEVAKEAGGRRLEAKGCWRLLTSAGNQKIVPLLLPHAPLPPAPPIGCGTQRSLGSVVCRVQAPSAEQRLEAWAWSPEALGGMGGLVGCLHGLGPLEPHPLMSFYPGTCLTLRVPPKAAVHQMPSHSLLNCLEEAFPK